MNAERIENEARARLQHAPSEFVTAYLFGSVARREAHDGSDVDIGVLMCGDAEMQLDAALRLELDLERALGRPVQVVVLGDAPIDLVFRVLRDGHILLDRDARTRHLFELKSLSLYYDFRMTVEPILYPKRPA